SQSSSGSGQTGRHDPSISRFIFNPDLRSPSVSSLLIHLPSQFHPML
ncbi:PPFIA1 isoform 13, partial [Pan troglodytes]